MKWFCTISVVMAMLLCAVPALTAEVEGCPVPAGAVKVALPSGLPPALVNALPGDIALPGEPFDSIDVYVKGHKHRRYMFVWSVGSRWIVAMEVGGIALRGEVMTYTLAKEGKAAVLLNTQVTFPERVCEIATKLAAR